MCRIFHQKVGRKENHRFVRSDKSESEKKKVCMLKQYKSSFFFRLWKHTLFRCSILPMTIPQSCFGSQVALNGVSPWRDVWLTCLKKQKTVNERARRSGQLIIRQVIKDKLRYSMVTHLKVFFVLNFKDDVSSNTLYQKEKHARVSFWTLTLGYKSVYNIQKHILIITWYNRLMM